MSDSVGVSLRDDDAVADNLSLSDLRAFVAIARSGSFRAAARQLFVSQPSLSRVVARLEAELGVQLFVRGPRGITTTEHGEALLTATRRVLDAVSMLRHDVAAPDEQHLRIGATATSARTLISPFLSHWIPENRDVRLTAIEDSDMNLAVRLDNGECDVALITSAVSKAFDGLVVASVQVHAYAPPGHRIFRTEGPLTVDVLAGESLLLNGPGFPSTELLTRAMESQLLHPEIAYKCSAGQTLAAMAEAGLGVAVFGNTTIMRGFDLERREVVDAQGKALRFDLQAAWRRDVATPLAREFGIALATFHRARAGSDEARHGEDIRVDR